MFSEFLQNPHDSLFKFPGSPDAVGRPEEVSHLDILGQEIIAEGAVVEVDLAVQLLVGVGNRADVVAPVLVLRDHLVALLHLRQLSPRTLQNEMLNGYMIRHKIYCWTLHRGGIQDLHPFLFVTYHLHCNFFKGSSIILSLCVQEVQFSFR